MEKYGIRVLDVMPLFVQTAMVNNMDAGSIQNMGVDLTPNDIAQQVLSLVEKSSFLDTDSHSSWYKTKLLYQLSTISPQFLNRLTNIYLSRK